jgi:hypothetical protein
VPPGSSTASTVKPLPVPYPTQSSIGTFLYESRDEFFYIECPDEPTAANVIQKLLCRWRIREER